MRNKSAKEIIGSVRFDHNVPIGLDGEDKGRNMQALSVEDHAVKTKTDVKNIAKAKRVRTAHEEFTARLLAKVGIEEDRAEEERRRAVLGTPPKRAKKKLSGRGFVGWRTFSGKPKWKRSKGK